MLIVYDRVNAVAKCEREECHAQVLESHPVILLGARVSVVLLIIKLYSWEDPQKLVLKIKADILNLCHLPQLNTKPNKTRNPTG
jgi:hypothetical protein